MAKRGVCVIGVGMAKFERCDRELCQEAITGVAKMAGEGPENFEQPFLRLRERHELPGAAGTLLQ